MKREFLCDGCRKNCGSNEDGTINCEYDEEPTKPIQYEEGMLYEQCPLRAAASGPSFEDLQELRRKALSGVPVYDPGYTLSI